MTSKISRTEGTINVYDDFIFFCMGNHLDKLDKMNDFDHKIDPTNSAWQLAQAAQHICCVHDYRDCEYNALIPCIFLLLINSLA